MIKKTPFDICTRYGIPLDVVALYAAPVKQNEIKWDIPQKEEINVLEKAIEDFKNHFNDMQTKLGEKKLMQKFDIDFEQDDKIQVITVELPGVAKNDIDLEIIQNSIFVNALKKDKEINIEITPIPGYDLNSCVASLNLGILTIKLFKLNVKSKIDIL